MQLFVLSLKIFLFQIHGVHEYYRSTQSNFTCLEVVTQSRTLPSLALAVWIDSSKRIRLAAIKSDGI